MSTEKKTVKVTEDTWTPPNWWCPEPQHWHADDAQATEHEVTELVAAFVRALQPDVAVETGTWTGQTTQAIGRALVRNGHGHLHAVEILPQYAEMARVLCAYLPVTVVTGDSTTWDPPGGIGFAWVDSGQARGADIELLLPRMLPGAIIGMHDGGPQHPFRGQLGALEARGLVRAVTLRTPRGVCFAEVM